MSIFEEFLKQLDSSNEENRDIVEDNEFELSKNIAENILEEWDLPEENIVAAMLEDLEKELPEEDIMEDIAEDMVENPEKELPYYLSEPFLKQIKDMISPYVNGEKEYKKQSKKSSAAGKYQFVDKTREAVLGGISREAFLNSPSLQEEAMDKLIVQNIIAFKDNGIDVDNIRSEDLADLLRTAHFRGSDEAVRIYRDQMDCSIPESNEDLQQSTEEASPQPPHYLSEKFLNQVKNLIVPPRKKKNKATKIDKYHFIDSTLQTILPGVSREEFLGNPGLQEEAMNKLLIQNINTFQNMGLDIGGMESTELANLLLAAHLRGPLITVKSYFDLQRKLFPKKRGEKDSYYQTEEFINRIKDIIASLESGKDGYKAESKNTSAAGKYQFMNATRKAILPDVSREEFLNSPSLQEEAMDKLIAQNIHTFEIMGIDLDAIDPADLAGLITAAHLQNPWDAIRVYRDKSYSGIPDLNGTLPRTFFEKGRKLYQ